METLKRVINRLVLPGFFGRLSEEVRIDALSSDTRELRDALGAFTSSIPIDLILSGALVLSKEHRIPTKARKQAHNILKLRSDAFSDLSQTKLVSTFRRTSKERSDDIYLQLLARFDDIETIKGYFAHTKLSLRSIWIELDGAKMLLWDNRAHADRALYRWWTVAFAICIGACCYSYVIGNGYRAELDELLKSGNQRLAVLQNEVDQTISSSDGAAQQRLEAIEIVETLRQGQWSGTLLRKLTEQIPERAWLTELAFDGNEVRISGTTSTEALEIVGELETTDWVTDVTLLRPFQRDNRTDLSSFDLLLAVDLSAL